MRKLLKTHNDITGGLFVFIAVLFFLFQVSYWMTINDSWEDKSVFYIFFQLCKFIWILPFVALSIIGAVRSFDNELFD